MKTTLYFCDKCHKQTNTYNNGNEKKNLYGFLINNATTYPHMDKHGFSLELCGECCVLFVEILNEFIAGRNILEKDIYKNSKKMRKPKKTQIIDDTQNIT